MKQSYSIIAASAGLAAFLASCAAPYNTANDFYDARSAHPISVEPTMRVLRIPYGGPQAGVDVNMAGQLEGFVQEYRSNGMGIISVSTPRGYESAGREFANRIAGLGIAPARIHVQTDPAPERGAEIKIEFIRYVAQAPTCGDWSESSAITAGNKVPPNFGCSLQHNLAVMVADPRDFVSPNPTTSPDLQRRLMVLDKYRQGEPTAAVKTDEQSGAVSEVGGN